jgi:hypothetical protein
MVAAAAIYLTACEGDAEVVTLRNERPRGQSVGLRARSETYSRHQGGRDRQRLKTVDLRDSGSDAGRIARIRQRRNAMTTVTILPATPGAPEPLYQAVGGGAHSLGRTPVPRSTLSPRNWRSRTPGP